MEAPIYSKRYPKNGKSMGTVKSPAGFPEPDKPLFDMDMRNRWKYIVAEKAIEISERNCYGMDIYENESTLMIDIFIDPPCTLSEFGGIPGSANVITISKAKFSRGLTLSISYDMEMI